MTTFGWFHWLLTGLFVGLAVLLFVRMLPGASGPAVVCTVCHHHGPARLRTRGSFLLELLLWLVLLVPGLAYSLWRLSTRQRVCAACGSAQVVPPDTPVGRKLRGVAGA